MKRTLHALFVVAWLFSLEQLSSAAKDAENQTPEPAAAGQGFRIEDIVEPVLDYHYASFGKPDPFQLPAGAKQPEVSTREKPILSPLQQRDLTQLKVVGTWTLPDGSAKALFLIQGDTAMQGIVAKIGDSIGKRNGTIVEIKTDGVRVREFTLLPDGTREFEDKVLPTGSSDKTAPSTADMNALRPSSTPAAAQSTDNSVITNAAAKTASTAPAANQAVPASAAPVPTVAAAPAGAQVNPGVTPSVDSPVKTPAGGK